MDTKRELHMTTAKAGIIMFASVKVISKICDFQKKGETLARGKKSNKESDWSRYRYLLMTAYFTKRHG